MGVVTVAVWIPGPEQYCWPAKPQPVIKDESPHQESMVEVVEEQPKPRTRKQAEV